MAPRLGNSTLRLELREDGLDWIAADHPEWRHHDGTIKIARVAEAAGLHRQALTRVLTNPTRYPDNGTIAAIARLGMTTRRVSYKTALDRIFQIVDLADRESENEAVAA